MKCPQEMNLRRLGLVVLLGCSVVWLGSECSSAVQQAGAVHEGQLHPEFFADRRAELRQEYEPRYGYADWPGRDAAALSLERVSLADLSVQNCSLVVEEVLSPAAAPTRSGGLVGGVGLRLRFADAAGSYMEASPIRLRFRQYASSLEAQSALMDSFADPLRNKGPSEGDGPAYDEQWVDGVGDVCFKTWDQIDCIVANVWLQLRFLDGPRPPCAGEDIASAIVTRLRATDAQMKLAAEPPARVVSKPVLVRQGDQPVEIAAHVVSEITVGPGEMKMLVIVREAAQDLPPPKDNGSVFCTSKGLTLRALEADGRTPGPYTVTFTEADKGMQEVMGVVVLEDNSIQFLRTTIEVR